MNTLKTIANYRFNSHLTNIYWIGVKRSLTTDILKTVASKFESYLCLTTERCL